MDSNGHHSGAARESSVVTKYTREFRINEKNNTEKRCKARGQYHPQVKTLRLFFLFLWLQFIVSIAVWNHYIFLLNTGFYQFEDISSLQVINRMFFLQIVGRFVGPLFFLLFIMKSCQRSKKTESVNRLKAFSVILWELLNSLCGKQMVYLRKTEFNSFALQYIQQHSLQLIVSLRLLEIKHS